jgi:F0F1-type ATP synthase membrane subunit a
MSRTHSLDRIGAVAGVAYVAIFLVLMNFLPAVPIPTKSVDTIASDTARHSSGILWAAYGTNLMVLALLVFGTTLAARLAHHGEGDWSLLALVGTAATSVYLVDNGVVSFVRAVGHGVRGDALWSAYPSGPDGVVLAIPMGLLLLAVGLGGRGGAFPSPLCVIALALAAAFVLGGAGVAGSEVDGGAFGTLMVLGFLASWPWAIAVSVHLWRHPVRVSAVSAHA